MAKSKNHTTHNQCKFLWPSLRLTSQTLARLKDTGARQGNTFLLWT